MLNRHSQHDPPPGTRGAQRKATHDSEQKANIQQLKSTSELLVGSSVAAGSTSEAWADFGSPVAVFPASAAAGGHVFAPIAGSVVGAFAPSADFSLHSPAVAPSAGDPAPASALRTAFPAVVGISGRVLRSPCSEEQGVDGVQDLLRALGQGGGEHFSLVAELIYCRGAVLQHDWRLGDRAPLPLSLVPLRAR